MKYLILIIFVILLFADDAAAHDTAGDDNIRINITFASKHTGKRPPHVQTHTTLNQNGDVLSVDVTETELPDFNESNPGLGVEWGIGVKTYALVGIYRNSYNDTSVYGGIGFDLATYKSATFVLEAFAVTGYEQSLIAGAAPGVRFNRHGHGIKINYVPMKLADSTSPNVITFQYQFSF